MKMRPIDGVRITSQMPATLSRKVSLRGAVFAPGGSSLTISQSARRSATVKAPTPRKVARQPKVAVANAIGAVASIAPSEPMPRWMPASVEKRSGANQRA